MSKPEGYVDVAERIVRFKEKYPDGVLVTKRWSAEAIEWVDPDGQPRKSTFICVEALAYRDPDDKLPAPGNAWEPMPGPTPFTRDSELMNAETAAWGRALVALGFIARDEAIATQQDVENRQGNGKRPAEGSDIPSAKQVDFMVSLAKHLGADNQTQDLLRAYASVNMTGGKKGTASTAINVLKGDHPGTDPAEALLRFVKKAEEWQAKQTDVPPDMEGLPQPDEVTQ